MVFQQLDFLLAILVRASKFLGTHGILRDRSLVDHYLPAVPAPASGVAAAAVFETVAKMSTNIVYGVTGGHHRLVYFILGIGVIQIFLCQLPNMNSITGVSSIAALTFFGIHAMEKKVPAILAEYPMLSCDTF